MLASTHTLIHVGTSAGGGGGGGGMLAGAFEVGAVTAGTSAMGVPSLSLSLSTKREPPEAARLGFAEPNERAVESPPKVVDDANEPARVTPASSPASHCKQCSALTSPALHARGCASPSRAR